MVVAPQERGGGDAMASRRRKPAPGESTTEHGQIGGGPACCVWTAHPSLVYSSRKQGRGARPDPRPRTRRLPGFGFIVRTHFPDLVSAFPRPASSSPVLLLLSSSYVVRTYAACSLDRDASRTRAPRPRQPTPPSFRLFSRPCFRCNFFLILTL